MYLDIGFNEGRRGRDCFFATPQAEDYYLYGRMLVRCFLDEVVHGLPGLTWLTWMLDMKQIQ